MTIINKQMEDKFAKHKKEIIKIMNDMNGKAHLKITEMLNNNRKLTEDISNVLLEQFKNFDKSIDQKIEDNNEIVWKIMNDKIIELLTQNNNSLSKTISDVLEGQLKFLNERVESNHKFIIDEVNEILSKRDENIKKHINNIIEIDNNKFEIIKNQWKDMVLIKKEIEQIRDDINSKK